MNRNRLSLDCRRTSHKRGSAILATALAALVACPALARTVTVASCDRTTGATTLAISAAEAGDGDKTLFAAWSPSSIADIADASETAYVGVVAASDTAKSFTIPSEWLVKFGFVSFFLMDDVPPYDTLLDYIRSASAGPYIDTGFVPTTKSDIRVKSYYPKDMAPFGISGKCYLFCIHSSSYASGSYYFGFFGASGSTDSAPRGTVPREYRINATGAYIDGNCYKAFSPSALTTTSTLTLFARKNDGDTTVAKQGDCTIYWAQLREDGVLVHDYVPCRKNGTATMYDRVAGTLCTVSGSGSFTAGEALDPDARDCGGVESSAAVEFTRPSATWDGGGADDSFATKENWVGDELPDLSGGLTPLTFATCGSSAQVPASGASAYGIDFDTADNFALTAASGGTLALGAGGITLANRAVASGSTWRLHNLELPVTLSDDQTWNLSSVRGQRLRVYGNLQGAASRTLTVVGKGCLSIYATNDFTGNLVLNGGVTKVFSKLRPFGSAAEGGEVFVDQSTGATLEFYYGAVIDKPLRIRSNSSGTTFSTGQSGDTAFLAPIYQTGDAFYILQGAGSTLTFGGGGTFGNSVTFHPEESSVRTVVVEGAPLVQSTYHSFSFKAKTELHLKNQGNQMNVNLGAASSGAGSTLHCWTNNVLNWQCDVSLGWGSFMDLHGFDQEVGDLKTGGLGRIRSAEPATLLAAYDGNSSVTWGAGAGVDGAVSFKKSGPTSLTINGTNTTTGALIAQNGPLVIGETGCWQGTNVLVGATNSNRHASLQLKRSNSFADPRHTMLTMTASTRTSGFNTDCGESREPELKLDAGVNAVFKDVILNGHRLAPGTWGGTSSSAQHKDATHFSGSGMITVTGGGFFLIVR